jgi:AraC-like DNA-binding protein
VLYVQYKPAAPLDRYVQLLWYANAPGIDHARQRILPTGSTQIILALSRDYLLDCPLGQPSRPTPPAQIIGARSTYEIIHTSDLACIIGLAFQPGGFPAIVGAPADLFANRSIDLFDLWGALAASLRDQLRELPTPEARLACLEAFLSRQLVSHSSRPKLAPHPAIHFAIEKFNRAPRAASVAEVARSTGWSERRFSQIFREQVGLSPKVWCRIQRFQRAVRQLHAGADVPWPELALDCGYYDQSHFANEFRAFSGIDITTYSSSARTLWANHIQES